MIRFIAWLTLGIIFGAGLCVSGMVNPRTVQAFLDVAGDWDPTLLFVLGGAVITTFIGYRVMLARARPVLAGQFHLPAARKMDARLITGASLFGIGWGLLGFCPGPAITSLASLHTEPALFVVAMIAGNMFAGRFK